MAWLKYTIFQSHPFNQMIVSGKNFMSENNNLTLGIRFNPVGKIYHFDAGDVCDIEPGDAVIVETSRGWQMGFVATVVEPSDVKDGSNLKKIDRKATPKDLMIRQTWQQKEAEVVDYCRQRITELGLQGIKIVSAEYSFDGKRLSVFYNFEGEGGNQVKTFRRELHKKYSTTKLEIRPLGPRDVAKTICGIGACGKSVRCCCSFLSEFSSISIRMAKNQAVSLTPVEITGICGRLRCCLSYEDEQYKEAIKGLPKKNKRIRTPLGEGRVVEIRALSEEIVVDIREVGKKVFTKEEVKDFPK